MSDIAAPDDMKRKIRALLDKAEGTDNPNEAEAFSAKAMELMAKYAITEAMLQKDKSGITGKVITFDISLTGEQYAKVGQSLAHVISLAFRCEMVVTQGWEFNFQSNRKVRTREMTFIGFESDISQVTTLYRSLRMQQMFAMATVKVPEYEHGKTFLQSFAIGFNKAVADRLTQITQAATNEAEADNPGTALVLVDRSQMVQLAFKAMYPKLTKGTGASASNWSGYAKGHEAGQRADLGSKGVGGTRKGING